MVERLSEKLSGRATSFFIEGAIDIESLANNLAGEIGCEFSISRSIKGNAFGFTAHPLNFSIFGQTVITGKSFEIITGVNHNLYDSYKVEYRELLGKIRNVVRSF